MSSPLSRVGVAGLEGQVILDDIITGFVADDTFVLDGDVAEMAVIAAAAGVILYVGAPHNVYALRLKFCDYRGRPTFWWLFEDICEPATGRYVPLSWMDKQPHVARMTCADLAMNDLLAELGSKGLDPVHSTDPHFSESDEILEARWNLMQEHMEQSVSEPYVEKAIEDRDDENRILVVFKDGSGMMVTPSGPCLPGVTMKIPTTDHPKARDGMLTVETHLGMDGHA